jgi:hypothetical protein
MSTLELQEFVAVLARSTKELRTSQQESDRYAFRNGLWVLKCLDGITSIANGENFQAQVF